MSSPPRNGDERSHLGFRSTMSEQRLRRLSMLILVLRFAAFCFTFAAAVFMATNSSGSISWLHFSSFKFVFAANAIVAIYSLFEMGATIWEVSKGVTLLPDWMQLWFDFGHDQVFAYMLLSAEVAGISGARGLRRAEVGGGFCLQSDIAVGLGFMGYGFLVLSALFSGYRVASYTITGSRFHL